MIGFADSPQNLMSIYYTFIGHEKDGTALVNLDCSAIPDTYVTAKPFHQKDTTPVKELNTGSMYSASPVHGVVVATLARGGRPEHYVCIGDSVAFTLWPGAVTMYYKPSCERGLWLHHCDHQTLCNDS